MKKFGLFLFGFLFGIALIFGVSLSLVSKNQGGRAQAAEGKFTVYFWNEYSPFNQDFICSDNFSSDDEVKFPEDREQPTKPDTKEYTYKFDGWVRETDLSQLVELSSIKESTVLYAHYVATPVDYEIEYQLGEGTLDTKTEKYNIETQAFTLGEPHKENASFVGWVWEGVTEEPEKPVQVDPHKFLGKRVYKAVYSDTQFDIEVKVADGDEACGKVSEDAGSSTTFQATYGANIVGAVSEKNGTLSIESTLKVTTSILEDPRKAYTYEFDYWVDADGRSVDNLKVTKNLTIIAHFKRNAISYNITYHLDQDAYTNGPTKYSVLNGKFQLMRAEKIGHNFLGWTGEGISDPTVRVEIDTAAEDFVFKDLEYTSHFELASYNINFLVPEEQQFGTFTIQPDSEEFNQTFSLKVKYGETLTFDDESASVTAGESTVMATPLADDDQYTYEFVWWNGVDKSHQTMPAQDITIYAIFSREVKKYEVYAFSPLTAEMLSGEMIGAGTKVEYGTTIRVTYTLTPHNHVSIFTASKQNPTDAQAVVTDLISLAQESEDQQGTKTGSVEFQIVGKTTFDFEEEIDTFQVSFVASPSQAGSVSVESITAGYGALVNANAETLTIGEEEITAITNPDTMQYDFEFERWEVVDGSTITEDVTFTAIFSATIKEYAVTFDETHVSVFANGSELHSGESSSYGTELTIQLHATNHHHEVSLEANGTDILETKTYEVVSETNIVYTEAPNQYRVDFNDGVSVTAGGEQVSNGELLTYEEGLTIVASYTLTKHYKLVSFKVNGTDHENNYSFELEGDVTIEFLQEKDKIQIQKAEAVNGTFELSASEIEAGEEVVVTATPNRYYKTVRMFYKKTDEAGDEEFEIEDGLFVMPDNEIMVYVQFELEYYHIEDSEYGIAFDVKVEEVSAEPQIVIEDKTNTYLELVSAVLRGSTVKIFSIKIMIGDQQIESLPQSAVLKIKLPEGLNATKAGVLKIVEGGAEPKYEAVAFSYSSSDGTLDLAGSGEGVFAVGEKLAADETPSAIVQAKHNGTLIAAIVVASAAVVLAVSAVIVVIVVKRRKRHEV